MYRFGYFSAVDECGHGGAGPDDLFSLFGRYDRPLPEPVGPFGPAATLVDRLLVTGLKLKVSKCRLLGPQWVSLDTK